TPYTSLEAIRNASTPPKLGAQSATHATAIVPKIVQAVTGIKLDVITGYPGSPEILLDIERGALDGRYDNTVFTQRPEWIENGFVRVFIFTGRQRHKDYPEVPSIVELVPDERRDLLAMVFGPEEVNRAMVGPPGIPPEIAEAV